MPATAALAAQSLVQHRFIRMTFFIIILGRKMAINSAAILTALARLIRWDNIRVLVLMSACAIFIVLIAQLHRALAVPLSRRCQCLRLASELWRY